MRPISDLMLKLLEPKIKRVETRISKRMKFLGLRAEYLIVSVAIMENGEEYEVSTQKTGWNPDAGDLTVQQNLPFLISLNNGSLTDEQS